MTQAIAQANGISIWYETFGRRQDPALLLIMGGCSQGILWPTDLCKDLAARRFFVIRYDHRDAGLSTCFDFDTAPYDYTDMTEDAVGLLDALEIEEAHLCGLSTGGMLAQIMAATHPSRVRSIALIATTCEIAPFHRALRKEPPVAGNLSPPTDSYLASMDEFLHHPPQTEEEQLDQRIAIWQLLNGTSFPLEESSQRHLHGEFLRRLRHRPGLENHIRASFRSEEIVRSAPPKITAPTVVFHGSEDPIFPPDHGKYLADAIARAIYIPLEGFGHIPNPHFFGRQIEGIVANIARY